MAGTLPDVPGRRFAYDADGTLVRVRHPDGTFYEVTPVQLLAMNNENSDKTDWLQGSRMGGQELSGVHYLTFVFPELRDLTGYFAAWYRNNAGVTHLPAVMQYSVDTTDGSDGTWVNITSPWSGIETSNVKGFYRNSIVAASDVLGVRGLRLGASKNGASASGGDIFGFWGLHLYGRYGATDGLRFWDPAIDAEMLGTQLEFPDRPQGSVTDRPFRLRNTSALTASAIQLSAIAQGGSDAGLANGLTFSIDGGTTYSASPTLASLAAGATSPVLYARRTVGAGEIAAQRSARVRAIASWA